MAFRKLDSKYVGFLSVLDQPNFLFSTTLFILKKFFPDQQKLSVWPVFLLFIYYSLEFLFLFGTTFFKNSIQYVIFIHLTIFLNPFFVLCFIVFKFKSIPSVFPNLKIIFHILLFPLQEVPICFSTTLFIFIFHYLRIIQSYLIKVTLHLLQWRVFGFPFDFHPNLFVFFLMIKFLLKFLLTIGINDSNYPKNHPVAFFILKFTMCFFLCLLYF